MSGKRCIDCFSYREASLEEQVYLRLMVPWYRGDWDDVEIITAGSSYELWCAGEHLATLPYFNQQVLNTAVQYYEEFKVVTGR